MPLSTHGHSWDSQHICTRVTEADRSVGIAGPPGVRKGVRKEDGQAWMERGPTMPGGRGWHLRWETSPAGLIVSGLWMDTTPVLQRCPTSTGPGGTPCLELPAGRWARAQGCVLGSGGSQSTGGGRTAGPPGPS